MGHKKKVYIDPKTLNLPLVGCDSHAHIVTPPLWEERDEVLLRAKEAGVRTIGEVLLGHKQYIEHKDYFDDKEHVFFIYGLHPTDLLEIDAGETERIYEDIMRDKKEKRKIRAVSEIGLDYYWKEVPHALQQEYFIKMLALAKQCALPVVIHSRDAFEDTVNILLEQGFHDYPLLWHCFDRDRECAEIVLSHGWHISIPGSVTYKANAHVREALKITDRERLLLETDSPYLSPEPWRGKPDEPAFTVFTAECVAKELEVGTAELWEQCGNNARRFFWRGMIFPRKKLNKFLKKPIKGIYCNKEAFMEIDTASLGSVQGQMSLGIQKQSLDFDAQMTNKLMQDSLQAADNMRASQGIGTNLNITA